jgi:predicted glycosyltransferase
MSAVSHSSDMPLPFRPYIKKNPAMRRFLFYSHDGLGLGHVRRNLAIAKALTEVSADASALVLTCAAEAESLGLPSRVSVAKLPGPHRSDQKVLAAAVEIFRPEVLLVDQHPFGPGGELGPALEIVRASGGQAVLGLPDVLDDASGVDLEWRGRGLFERIPQYFARVLVYGQPDVLDPVRDCGFPDALAQITSFCGYVVSPSLGTHRAALRPYRRRARVLATTGEGDDGFPVLDAFVTAAEGAGWDATVVAGAHCPQDRRQLLRSKATAAGIVYREFVPALPSEFASLDALVCMGGYNTLAEAVATGVPTVCVPRVEPSRDQLVRARAFASRRLLRVLERDELEPERLRHEIDAALAEGCRPAALGLDLGGDRRAAHHLFEVAARRPPLAADEVLPLELTAKLAVAAAS